MAVMLMMKVAFYQVIHMVAVRHRFVSATSAVDVTAGVAAADVAASAGGGVRARDLNDVLVVMAVVRVVQMTVVEKVDVISVLNGRMSAAGAVLMGVIAVRVAIHESNSFSFS